MAISKTVTSDEDKAKLILIAKHYGHTVSSYLRMIISKEIIEFQSNKNCWGTKGE